MYTNSPKSLLLAGLLLMLASCGGTSNIGVNPNPGGADTTKPVLGTISGVSDAATLSGTVAISAVATDNRAVTSFTLRIDGSQVASFANGSLSYSWDTTTATNAAHTLLFTASDLAGNTESRTINLSVNNAGGGGGGGGGTTGTVSGIIYAPNGTDPLSQALVYIPDGAGTPSSDPPGVSYHAYDLTEPDGSFSLPGIPVGVQSIIMKKGAFTKTLSYTVAAGTNALSGAQTTMPASSGSSMLVVTGNYDLIENVLAKLGLGSVNSSGSLVYGTESFDIVDGNFSLDDAEYGNFDTFFATPSNFDNYRTIFLNCGNSYEAEFLADSAAVAKLKSWVGAGGRLYCTDWSYDFCEQLWPEMISFYGATGADGLTATAGTPNTAQLGASMDTVPCSINDAFMLSWMDGVGATNVDDSFDVIDWLPAWVPMISVAPQVKVWARGNVTYGFPAETNDLPVTVSFDAGDGVVMFSSYHTEEFLTTELTAQDRVLQYLIFEIL